jgi:hypothetical protein
VAADEPTDVAADQPADVVAEERSQIMEWMLVTDEILVARYCERG